MSTSLERLASACLLPGFEGSEPPDWLLRALDGGLGGVVLFSRNVVDRQQLARLTASLRAARPGVLVCVDEEGGDVTRLDAGWGSAYPGNLALGVVDDPELTRAVASSLGAELGATGINLDLAPVADVNTNPDNPVIGVRSFGADPALVARHVVSFVEGLQHAGVAACAKHFPGHGDTSVDSHVALPVVEKTLAELREVELVPFRAAVQAGVQAVMTAHVVVPAISPLPATVSREHLTGLLREELGFRGLAVTDALEMRAVDATVGRDEAAVLALAAGADAVCLGHDAGERELDAARAVLVAAVRDGRLAEERLAEAAARVVAAAAWASSAGGAGAAVRRDVGLEAARRAIRVEGTPLLDGPLLVIECTAERLLAADPTACSLGDLLREREPATLVRAAGSSDDAGRLLAGGDGRRPVLVLRDAHRHAWQRPLAEAVLRRRPDTVVVDVGLPAWRPPAAAGYVAAYGCGLANLLAVAERVAPASG